MKKHLTLILGSTLLLAPLSTFAQACQSGRVRDDDGNALAHVQVSDGRQISRSDADGRYAFAQPPSSAVFVIKPAGYQLGRDAHNLPRHWRSPNANNCDFVLLRSPSAPSSQPLKVLLLADPQVGNHDEIDYFDRDIITPLKTGNDATLGIMLGDIVNDDLDLYPAMLAVSTQLAMPWLHIAGNHDIDMSADDTAALATFGRYFGPDTFAWEEAGASFILLDNVIWRPDANRRYIGGLRAQQLEFVENYLRHTDKNRLIVLAMHIPLFEPEGQDSFRDEDRAQLFALLRDFPNILLLSGHTHIQQHYFHDQKTNWHGSGRLHEYNVGAASGAFWSGVKDAQGIPRATMADGTPNGYAQLHVYSDGRYTLDYHAARAPHGSNEAAGIGVFAPTVLRQGAYPAWGVYANVWMGLPETVVEYRINQGPWQPMRRVVQPDPALSAENAADNTAQQLRSRDRSPEAIASTHLWRGALPTDLPADVTHHIEIRATDHWHGPRYARSQYRLQQWPLP